jgi:predicted phosphodiesterase
LKDIELLIQVRGEHGSRSRLEAVKLVAEKNKLSIKGVSGRVTRAEQTIKGRVALMRWQQDNALYYDKAQVDINDLVVSHQMEFDQHAGLLNRPYYAVFLTDTHFPYHDVDALALTYDIISDLPGVAYISGLSDGFDFSTLSRWPDGRRAQERALDSDLRGVLDAYNYHLDTLSQIAPDALILALVGNHDYRLIANNSGNENYLQLEVMKSLTKHGLTFLSDFSRENIIRLTKRLYWYHGKHARKNRVGGAKANYEHVKSALDLDHDFTLIFGHVHEPTTYHYIKAAVYGSGCLCQLQPHYSRHRQQWGQGIVISRVDGDQVQTYQVPYLNLEGVLSAYNPFVAKYYEISL